MQDTIDYVNNLNDKTLIKLNLNYLKQNGLINEREFNTISRENGFRTRFHGFGLMSLSNCGNCWMRKYQMMHGPIIKKHGNNYRLTDVWKNILDRADF